MAVALKAYYDGSGSSSDPKTPFVTLAGYAAPPSTWTEFEREWPAVLGGKGKRPPCHYLHMAEMYGPDTDEDSAYIGWTENDKSSLLKDVYELLYRLGWNRELNFTGLVSTVNKADYERACADLPHLTAVSIESICIDHVGWWAIRLIPDDPQSVTGKAGSVELFFDQNEPFRGALMPRWNKKWSKRAEVLKHIAGMPEADMRTTPALQAADYLAWFTNRYRTKNATAAQFWRLLSSPVHERFFDYDELVRVYRDWRPE